MVHQSKTSIVNKYIYQQAKVDQCLTLLMLCSPQVRSKFSMEVYKKLRQLLFIYEK